VPVGRRGLKLCFLDRAVGVVFGIKNESELTPLSMLN